jgi:hypothetical protein
LEKIIINSILVAIYTIKNTSYAKKIGIWWKVWTAWYCFEKLIIWFKKLHW